MDEKLNNLSEKILHLFYAVIEYIYSSSVLSFCFGAIFIWAAFVFFKMAWRDKELLLDLEIPSMRDFWCGIGFVILGVLTVKHAIQILI